MASSSSSSLPTPNNNRREQILRKKLSLMSYTLPPTLLSNSLTPDIMSLVEVLFNDLVSTTEAYEGLTTKEEVTSNELQKAQAQLFPLRKENTKLIRENNQLHTDIIRSEEEVSRVTLVNEQEVMKLESLVKEGEFVQLQKDGNLERVRGECEMLKGRIRGMLGGGGGMKELEADNGRGGVGGSIEFTGALLSSSTSPSNVNDNDNNDMIAVTDKTHNNQVKTLTTRITNLESLLNTSTSSQTLLKQTTLSLEREITRLSALLSSGGRDYDSLSDVNTTEGNVKMLDQLNRQVDFLNGQLAEKDGVVSGMSGKVREFEKVKSELGKVVSENTKSGKLNSKLKERVTTLSSRVVSLEDENSNLKVNVEDSVKSVMMLKSEFGVRGSGGSLVVSADNFDYDDDDDYNKQSHNTAQLTRQITTLRIDMTSLTSANNQLVNDNQRLNDELFNVTSANEIYSDIKNQNVHDTDAINTRINRLTIENTRLSTERDTLILENDKLKSSTSTSTAEIEIMQSKITQIKSDLNTSTKHFTRLKIEYNNLNDIVVNKDLDVQNLTSALRTSHLEVKVLKSKLVEVGSEINDLKDRLGDDRDMNESVVFEKDRYKIEASEAWTAATSSKRTGDAERNARVEAQRLLNESQRNEKTALKRNAVLEDRAIDIESLLKSREKEVVALKNRLVELEELDPDTIIAETKMMRQSAQANSKRAGTLEGELENVTRERLRLTVNLSRAEDEIGMLKRGIESSKLEMSKLRDTTIEYRDTCDSLEQGKARAEAEREHLRTMLSQENASSGVRIESSNYLEKEREKLVGKIAELEVQLESERKRRNDCEKRNGSAVDEINRLKFEIQSVNEAKDALDGRFMRAANEINDARSTVSALSTDLTTSRAEVSRERAARSAAEVREQNFAGNARENLDRLTQLKSLFSQLERTRDNLVSKLQLKSGEMDVETDKLEREVQRNLVLTSRTVKLEQDKEIMLRNLENIDEERDALEGRIDELSDAVKYAKANEEDANVRADNAENAACEVKERAEGGLRALAAREKEVMKLSKVIQSLQSDGDELRRVLIARERELERSSLDLTSMTREAQAVSIESGRVAGELNSTRIKLNEAMNNMQKSEHKARAVELEKSSLLASYRAVVDERGALEGGVEELGLERTHLGAEVSNLKAESERSHNVIHELENELRRKSADMAAFERQLDGISRSNLAVQRTLEAAEVENRRLKTDLYSARQSSGGLARHSSDLQRIAAEKGEEAVAMRSVVGALEAERDGLQRLLAEERNHGNGIETLLNGLRAQSAASADQIRKLARENAGLQTKINEANINLEDARSALENLARGGSGIGSGDEEGGVVIE